MNVRAPARAALVVGYRAAVAVVGATIVLVGLALVPLPGPGWPVVFLGLAVLSSEFAWAARIRVRVQRHVTRGLRWSASASLAIRVALVGATVASLVVPLIALAAWL